MTKKLVRHRKEIQDEINYCDIRSVISFFEECETEHPNASIYVSAEDDYGSPLGIIALEWNGEETDKQYKYRVKQEKVQKEREFLKYQELKKMFEGETE